MNEEPSNQKPIPLDEWETIVRNVPLISVDLVILYQDGVLLGLRENEPAKGKWFVPGGTVLKNEQRTDAVHRVAQEELGVDVLIERRIGTFEHFYQTSEIEGVDSKHYLATAFVVTAENEEISPDEQHSQIQVVEPPFNELHPYVQQYLDHLDW